MPGAAYGQGSGKTRERLTTVMVILEWNSGLSFRFTINVNVMSIYFFYFDMENIVPASQF